MATGPAETFLNLLRFTSLLCTILVGAPLTMAADPCQTHWSGGWAWNEVGDEVVTLAVFDDGTGSALYAGGYFSKAGGVLVNRIGKWSAAGWQALGSGVSYSGAAYVTAIVPARVGTSRALYAGGEFSMAGGKTANHLARWDGTAWAALGTGITGTVYALAEFDDGSGSALYAGGVFTHAGSQPAANIAKWNGQAWSTLGTGISGQPGYQSVHAMCAFDDGSGPALYVGGTFTTAGGQAANRLARWNGTTWSALGTGFDGAVSALAVFDDGSGPALYAAGASETWMANPPIISPSGTAAPGQP